MVAKSSSHIQIRPLGNCLGLQKLGVDGTFCISVYNVELVEKRLDSLTLQNFYLILNVC